MNASREFLTMFLGLMLGLAPVTAFGVTGTSETPPVEQALVPEGAFAIQLAEALKMGSVEDEAQAESQLSALGIEPKNGWIAGYPMTPPVMVEIEKGVAAAAESGKLKMRKEEALKAVRELKIKLGLDVSPPAESQLSAGQSVPKGRPASTAIYKYIDRNGVIHFTDQYGSIPREYLDRVDIIKGTDRSSPSGEPAALEMQPPPQSSIPSPGPEVVNHYYYDYGPPVVTYYPPPEPYYYLYSWVPYPFWWGPGLYFSGFFILHDFHRHVGFHGRHYVCTNHVFAHNRGFVVNPYNHRLQDSRMVSRVSSPQAFNSPKVQSSARTIVGISQNRPAWGSVQAKPRTAAPTSTPTENRFQAPPTRPNSPGVQAQPKMTSPTSTPTVNRFKGPPRPSTQQRASNGMAIAPGNNSGRSGAPPTRTFSSPPPNGRTFTPSPPRVAGGAPAAVMHGPVYSAPAPSGRGAIGGGVQGSGDLSGSGGFGSRGGSLLGSSRGGHR